VVTDPSGRYMVNYKRWHLIGLELPISVASVGIRREPTGVATEFRGDVVAVSKRALKAGEVLDGEGGYTVSGGLRPAPLSVAKGYLPLGLAHNVTLRRDVAENTPVTWDDVEVDTETEAFRLRKQVEAMIE